MLDLVFEPISSRRQGPKGLPFGPQSPSLCMSEPPGMHIKSKTTCQQCGVDGNHANKEAQHKLSYDDTKSNRDQHHSSQLTLGSQMILRLRLEMPCTCTKYEQSYQGEPS